MSLFKASKADIWFNCPGSITAGLQCTSPAAPGVYRDEGKEAHALAAKFVEDMCQAKIVGIHSNSSEMSKHAFDFAEIIAHKLREIKVFGGDHMGIEKYMEIPLVHPDCSGTPDVWAYDQRHKTAHIWELKYGHRFVDAYENKQLLCYASGLSERFPEAKKFNLMVYQPRYYDGDKFREWGLSLKEMGGYLPELKEATENALSDKPRFKVGEHCRWCDARHDCATLLQDTTSTYEYVKSSKIAGLDAKGTAVELKLLKDAKIRVDIMLEALESSAIEMISCGKLVPGFSMSRGSGSLAWNIDMKALKTIALVHSIVPLTKETPITPLQAIKKGLPQDVVDSISERLPGKLKLKQNILKKGK